jgi:acyl-CoA thioester hydrolase
MARHLYRCPLRWADMDAFGHVNNVVFLRYLEEARVDLMFRPVAEGVPADDTVSFSSGCVVARHEIDYLRPLVHRHEPVTIETWVTKLRAASVTLAYEVKDEGELYARALTVLVPYNLRESHPRRFTPRERDYLKGFLDEESGEAVAA